MDRENVNEINRSGDRGLSTYFVRSQESLEDAKEDVGRSCWVLIEVAKRLVVGRLGHDTPIVESVDAVARFGDEANHPLRVAVARDRLICEVVLDFLVDGRKLLRELSTRFSDWLQFVCKVEHEEMSGRHVSKD